MNEGSYLAIARPAQRAPDYDPGAHIPFAAWAVLAGACRRESANAIQNALKSGGNMNVRVKMYSNADRTLTIVDPRHNAGLVEA